MASTVRPSAVAQFSLLTRGACTESHRADHIAWRCMPEVDNPADVHTKALTHRQLRQWCEYLGQRWINDENNMIVDPNFPGCGPSFPFIFPETNLVEPLLPFHTHFSLSLQRRCKLCVYPVEFVLLSVLYHVSTRFCLFLNSC